VSGNNKGFTIPPLPFRTLGSVMFPGGDWERGVVLRGGARVYIEALSLANTARIYFLTERPLQFRGDGNTTVPAAPFVEFVRLLSDFRTVSDHGSPFANCYVSEERQGISHQSPLNVIPLNEKHSDCERNWSKRNNLRQSSKSFPNEKSWKLNGCALRFRDYSLNWKRLTE
jgi:hypothetical protein